MSHVLSQLFPAIECVFEHIVVEIVDDVFGHVENGEPDEEWLHNYLHLCIQLDTNQILGIYGDSRNIIISILLNNNLAFILCGGELYFHSFQFSLHEFALC